MRILGILMLTAALSLSGPALADPQKQALNQKQQNAAHDASGRFALQASMQRIPVKAISASGQFELKADLGPVQLALPANGRYTLSSKLGDALLGTCGGGLPDAVFVNGFEN